MGYKLLGKSGLRVSELALGTMTFGEDWGWGATKEETKNGQNIAIGAVCAPIPYCVVLPITYK